MKQRIDTALTQIRHGKHEGLAQLYELTSRAVFAFVLSMINDYQLAEDIMQETYVHVYKSNASYKEGINGLSWIYTIASNMTMTILEKRNREQETDFDSQIEMAGATLDNHDFDSPTIDLAKRILNEDEQSILFLYTIGEYKHREIAAMLGIPLGTVTWKYQEAIKKMKEHLRKEP